MVPAHVARLAAYAALALLGAMQWQRLIAGLSAGRAILWVVVGVLAALAVLWASTRERWAATLTLGATLASLLGAYAASGLPLHLLKPREWDDLIAGLWGGAEALGTVTLPYDAADPWPALTLQLLGALLCVLAALLAFWPREHGRGHLFLSLATLLVMVASPVVSIGGSNQVLLGAALAALTVCFLWLERLPRRSWIGIAVLGVAVVGSLPLAAAADGDSPWFDYRAWAEEFGPGTPVAFDWGHSYGPLDWPREGSEVLRVDARRPSYWKVENLDEFDGAVWRTSGISSLDQEAEDDLAEDYLQRPQWTEELRVTVRRLEGDEVVTAGTALRVEESSRPVREGEAPGSYVASDGFASGDSYTVTAHVPRPSPDQLAEATTGREGRHVEEELQIAVPLRRDAATEQLIPRTDAGAVASEAIVRFPAFDMIDAGQKPVALFPEVRRLGPGGRALRVSHYSGTWRLARQLRAEATTPYEYVLAIDRYLQDGFTYSEKPAPDPARAHRARRLPDRDEERLLPALLGRDGAAAPDGRRAGAGRHGLRPRRALRPQGRLDRPRHGRALLGGGVVRRVRLGHVRPDAARDPGPLPDRGADRRARGARARAAMRAGAGAGRTGDVRPDFPRSQSGPGGASTGAGAEDGGISTWWLAPPLLLAAAGGAWWLARRRWRSRPVGGRLERLVAELEAALRRLGRPATEGMTLQQVEAGLRRTPQAAAYVRALRAGRYSPAATLPTPAQRRALRSALARDGGPFGRIRALLALPPWRA